MFLARTVLAYVQPQKLRGNRTLYAPETVRYMNILKLANLFLPILFLIAWFAPLMKYFKTCWTGPVGDMDESGDPYLDQFINARAEGPIEAVR